MRLGIRVIGICVLCSVSAAVCTLSAVERTILIGPKTIGKAWKDNIVLEPRHFAHAHAGDIITVYNDNAKRTAQGAFQNPKTWQGIAPEYGYFGINGPFRMTLTEDILAIAREHGIAIGGHDYRILQVTLSEASDYRETIVWSGPSVVMKDDWSANAEIPASCLKDLHVGDGLRLHISKVKPNAAAKLMDFTWNALDPSLDGVPVGGEAYTWYIYDNAPLLKLALAGSGGNVAMRIGGTGYRLDGIGIVQQVGEVSEDYSEAQRAPKEYVLQPGELFHGWRKVFSCRLERQSQADRCPVPGVHRQRCTDHILPPRPCSQGSWHNSATLPAKHPNMGRTDRSTRACLVSARRHGYSLSVRLRCVGRSEDPRIDRYGCGIYSD